MWRHTEDTDSHCAYSVEVAYFTCVKMGAYLRPCNIIHYTLFKINTDKDKKTDILNEILGLGVVFFSLRAKTFPLKNS